MFVIAGNRATGSGVGSVSWRPITEGMLGFLHLFPDVVFTGEKMHCEMCSSIHDISTLK